MRPDSSSTSFNRPEWSRPPSPRATMAPTSGAMPTAAPSGIVTRPATGGRGHDAHVLVVQGEPEAGLQLTGEHGRALPVEHGAACEPAAEHLQRRVGVHAVRAQEHDRSASSWMSPATMSGLAALDRLARARRPTWTSSCRPRRAPASPPRSPRPHRDMIERLASTAPASAADRRVQHPQARLPPRLLPGRRRPAGSCSCPRRARPGGRWRTRPRARGDRLHVRGVGHHRDHDVRVAHRRSDVVGATAAVFDQLLDFPGAAVVPDDLEPRLDEVRGLARP